MPKYLSGRVKQVPQGALSTNRYQYLGLDQAEPNSSNPTTLGISDGISIPPDASKVIFHTSSKSASLFNLSMLLSPLIRVVSYMFLLVKGSK